MAREERATLKRESAEEDTDVRDYRESSLESCIVLAISTVVAPPHAKRTAGPESCTGKESPVRPVQEQIESEEEDRTDMLMSLSMAEPYGRCRPTAPKPLDFSCHEQNGETLPNPVNYGIPEERSEKPTMKHTPSPTQAILSKRIPRKATTTYLEIIAIENKIAKAKDLEQKLQDKMDHNWDVILDCDVSIDVECRAIESATRRGRPFLITWSIERQRYLTSKRKNLQNKNAEMEGVRKRRCKKLDGLMCEKRRLEEEAAAY
ncbi:uncharacterized protein BKA55DRAFT_581031 [Fusarium redolens]|uniref:Uncharacterized protein n=1 Tax=Fusarium redolens TaxID=48865 RepID=A0A9P9G3F4_FUSRE|nr:uncharacterized protein BKA55DRAFT_581031 [Fusarium redolens]KAH7232369.1 hypothetical protein BKA55DRAFT_581031 [Fusarium redolens]